MLVKILSFIFNSIFRIQDFFSGKKSHVKSESDNYFEIFTNASGFYIIDINGNKLKEFSWDLIINAEFDDLFGLNEIKFFFEDGKSFSVDDMLLGYFNFLKNIPKNFSSLNYILIDEYFNDRIGCKICGFVSVNKEKFCDACYNDDYATLESPEIDELSYIQDKQLDYFFDYNGLKERVLKINNNTGFDYFEEWQPYISKEDFEDKE